MLSSALQLTLSLPLEHVEWFRSSRRRRPTDDGRVFGAHVGGPVLLPEEPEPEGARAIFLHCGDGGSEEQLMLCDGHGCSYVRRATAAACGRDVLAFGVWVPNGK